MASNAVLAYIAACYASSWRVVAIVAVDGSDTADAVTTGGAEVDSNPVITRSKGAQPEIGAEWIEKRISTLRAVGLLIFPRSYRYPSINQSIFIRLG